MSIQLKKQGFNEILIFLLKTVQSLKINGDKSQRIKV